MIYLGREVCVIVLYCCLCSACSLIKKASRNQNKPPHKNPSFCYAQAQAFTHSHTARCSGVVHRWLILFAADLPITLMSTCIVATACVLVYASLCVCLRVKFISFPFQSITPKPLHLLHLEPYPCMRMLNSKALNPTTSVTLGRERSRSTR